MLNNHIQTNEFEIERKFLIVYPRQSLLSECQKSEITQTYLLAPLPNTTLRVRKRTSNEGTIYTMTQKQRISGIKCVETEQILTKDEYDLLLKKADPKRNVIIKERYLLSYKDQTFEIDIYPFWHNQAVMELELSNENQTIHIPDSIRIIREVTFDKRYKNRFLAKEIPQEDEHQ